MGDPAKGGSSLNLFADPAVSLQTPATFGVISTQFNSPRIVQLGLHFDF
jgi:hypothetical protein